MTYKFKYVIREIQTGLGSACQEKKKQLALSLMLGHEYIDDPDTQACHRSECGPDLEARHFHSESDSPERTKMARGHV